MTRGGPWPHVGLAALAVAAAAVVADPAPRVEEAFRFADRDIAESSGLAVADGLVLTVNDSGDDPVIYAVDPATGETVGRTTYTSDAVEDVEALAVGPDGTVWVGDIGDNGRDRDSVALYAVPPVQRGDRTLEAPRYDLTYPDGALDAETLLADPRDGRLYVVTKELFGAGKVYAVPRRLTEGRTHVLRQVAAVKGLLTDGTFTADGDRALLRGYGRVFVADTDTWRYLANMPLPDQRQGEGIALADDPEKLLVSSEGARTAVLLVPMTQSLVDALDEGASRPQTADDRQQDDEPEEPGVFHRHGRLLKIALGVVLLVALGVAAVVRSLRGSRRRSRSRR